MSALPASDSSTADRPDADSAGTAPAKSDATKPKASLLRTIVKGLLIPLFALTIVLGLIGYTITHWERWVGLASTQTTDDAQIRAETSRIASRISGTVRTVAVQDFQRVHAGDLLVEIDPADYAASVAKAEANVAAADAALANLDNQAALQRATIAQAEASRASAAAQVLEARQERQRQEALLTTGSGSRQKVEQVVASDLTAKAGLQSAEAAIEAQNRQLDVLSGTKRQRIAELAAAKAALDAAKLQLDYTRIVAPFDGVVGERQVQVGNYVSVGTNLIPLVPSPDVYVIANYKETQLTNVTVGQAVEIAVDGLPGIALHGRVERISPASGSQFALLPADNATGNFTKVVQRIPVRIALDTDQPQLDRLRPGMSVITSIQADGTIRAGAKP